MMSKFCSNCGTKLDDGANFCSKCGAPQSTVEQTGKTASETTEKEDAIFTTEPIKPTDSITTAENGNSGDTTKSTEKTEQNDSLSDNDWGETPFAMDTELSESAFDQSTSRKAGDFLIYALGIIVLFFIASGCYESIVQPRQKLAYIPQKQIKTQVPPQQNSFPKQTNQGTSNNKNGTLNAIPQNKAVVNNKTNNKTNTKTSEQKNDDVSAIIPPGVARMSANGIIRGTYVHRRGDASLESDIYGYFDPGEKVRIIGVKNEWFLVQSKGEQFWVAKEFCVVTN